MISASNEQLQQELQYTLLKPDCHSWSISKMQTGHENTLEERYAIKLFLTWKKARETYRMLQTAFRPSYINLASVPFEIISPSCNALVLPFQQLLEVPIEFLLCDRVNDLRHSLFHLLNCLITTESELRE